MSPCDPATKYHDRILVPKLGIRSNQKRQRRVRLVRPGRLTSLTWRAGRGSATPWGASKAFPEGEPRRIPGKSWHGPRGRGQKPARSPRKACKAGGPYKAHTVWGFGRSSGFFVFLAASGWRSGGPMGKQPRKACKADGAIQALRAALFSNDSVVSQTGFRRFFW